MVSLALVAGVIVLIFVSLGNQGRVASEQFVEVDLQTQLRRGNDEIFSVLADAHLIALSDDARWVDFNYPKQAVDAVTKIPIPGALELRTDGTVTYGIFDSTTTPQSWIDNGFYHLETVDDAAETVTVSGNQWYAGQNNADFNVNGSIDTTEAAGSTLTFVPVRFEMTSYRRSAADLGEFNKGTNALAEANRLTKGYPRLIRSAVVDYLTKAGNKYAEPNPTGLSNVETNGPFKMYTRTLTLRCYRDSTPRLAAPYDKGEGVFYMRRLLAPSPLQQANSWTAADDTNGNGEYDDGEHVSPDIYSLAPIVYKGQYCPADTDYFLEDNPDTINNVCDFTETNNLQPSLDGASKRYYHSIKIVLYAVHDAATGGLSRGIQGVKRVLSSQTAIRLRNGNIYR